MCQGLVRPCVVERSGQVDVSVEDDQQGAAEAAKQMNTASNITQWTYTVDLLFQSHIYS